MIRKIFLIVLIAIILVAVLIVSQSTPKSDSTVYHVTLADPSLYSDGVFVDTFKIQAGSYQFSFVPNGDSPQMLSIILKGIDFSHAQDFKLNGTLHNTGISNYYTWDYSGNKNIQVQLDQDLQITINPHGDTTGSVSVYLKKIST